MKLFKYYLLITLCCFIQSVIAAQSSSVVLNDAINMQYADPRSAIALLLNNSNNLASMSDVQFLAHQRLLLRLTQTVEENSLSNEVLQSLNERFANAENFQPWLKVLNSSSFLLNQKYAKADELLKDITPLILSEETDVFKMWFYAVTGELRTKQNLYEHALENLNKANELAVNLKNKYIQMKVLSQLVVIDYYRQEYDKALENSKNLKEMATSLNDSFFDVTALSSTMNIYYMLGVTQQKLIDTTTDENEKQRLIKIRDEYQLKSKQVMAQTLKKSREIGALKTELRALVSLQNQHLENNLYDETIAVAKETIALATKQTLLYEKAVSYNNISIAHRLNHQYEESIAALKEAEIIYREIENEQSMLWVLEDYSLTYEAYGKTQLALDYYKKLLQATLALQNKTNNKKVIELQETFKNEKNISEIERLKQQHQINTAKLEAEEFQKLIFIAFGITLLIIIFFIWRNSRVISAKNDLLDEFNAKLKEQTLKDPLTGLYNRRLLNEIQDKLSNETIRRFIKSPTTNQNIGLILLDIDYFKAVNDKYGHDVGDEVIQQISSDLLSAIRESDYVIRWGGEEFLIVLTDTTEEGIKMFCQRMLDQRNSQAMTALTENIEVTFSLGFSLFPFVKENPSWLSWNETIKLVDNCLYIAKHHGRNQAVSVSTNNEHATDEQKELLLHSIADEQYKIPDTIKVNTIKPNV